MPLQVYQCNSGWAEKVFISPGKPVAMLGSITEKASTSAAVDVQNLTVPIILVLAARTDTFQTWTTVVKEKAHANQVLIYVHKADC